MENETSPSNDAVRKQLERILKSDAFGRATRQKEFLKYIIEETLQGRTSSIKAYSIAVDVYERDGSFNPLIDPIVRVEAGRLRRKLANYYLHEGNSDLVVIDIPKGSYIPVYTFGGETAPDKNTSTQRIHKTVEPQSYSIAVLPIKNLQDSQDSDYFSDGLTEEITSELARYQGLQVIATQSSLYFKEKTYTYIEIGKQLGARFLLDGSIRENANTIKATLRLVDSSSGQQLWNKGYKKQLNPTDLISLQEEIAQSVVGYIADQFGTISRTLSHESRKEIPVKMKDYDAVLRFHRFEQELSLEAFESAFSALNEAVLSQPNYGLAWSVLGHLHADNHALGFIEVEEPLYKAEQCAKKGASLVPESQIAHDSLALVYFHRSDKERFYHHAERSMALNPNAPYIVGVTGWHMMLFGDWQSGRKLLAKGMRLNPFYPTWFHLALFADNYQKGEYHQALDDAEKFNYPELFWDQVMKACSLVELGCKEKAQLQIRRLLDKQPDFADNSRCLMGNYIKVEKLVDRMVSGLQRAGLVGIS